MTHFISSDAEDNLKGVLFSDTEDNLKGGLYSWKEISVISLEMLV